MTTDGSFQLASFDMSDPVIQSMENIIGVSSSLWQESSLEQLIDRYCDILVQDFKITIASHMMFINRDENLDWKDSQLKLGGTLRIDSPILSEILVQLRLLNLKTLQYKQGLNTLTAAGNLYHFVLIGEPTTEWSTLIWKKIKTHDTLLSAEASEHYAQYLNLEYAARQFQNMAKWLSRLDKTQALLYRDDLTGLYNHRFLEVALDGEIKRTQRFQTSFSLLFIDLDNFKSINDRHGHLAGSSLLKQVADVLRDDLREVDSIFRYGGDEFVVLLLESNSNTAIMTAERIRKSIEGSQFIIEDGIRVSITASIGVASSPEHTLDKEELLKLADECMYRGKKDGKNKVEIFKRTNLREISDDTNIQPSSAK